MTPEELRKQAEVLDRMMAFVDPRREPLVKALRLAADTLESHKDIVHIIEELYEIFNTSEDGDYKVQLLSSRGSNFHSRVENAAKHLGVPYGKDRAHGQK